MKKNKIVPLSDSFQLPDSPLKDKFILDSESPLNLEHKTAIMFERIQTLPLELMLNNTVNIKTMRGNTMESEEGGSSPVRKSTSSKIFYQYFKNLLDEQQNNGKQELEKIGEFEDREVDLEQEYERLMDEPPEENQSLYVAKRSAFELLNLYTDKYPFLEFRKYVWFMKTAITWFCGKLINTRAFEILCIAIILWNTVMLFLDDPYTENDIGNFFDTYFQGFYTFEMSVKIFALGFIWPEGSYLRNGWNVLDFFIVVTGFLPYVMTANTSKLSGLRTLRVLRPLKTISSLKHLKLILMSLFSAMPQIMNAVFILFFLLLIYAIAALQLFMGTLKRRCFDKSTGLLILQNFDTSYTGYLCGYTACPSPDIYICGKQLATPNSSITNFDTVLWSLLMMFQEITLENWSINMYYVARTFNYYTVFFFLSLAFIGAMIFLNLVASIISQNYEQQSEGMNQMIEKKTSKVGKEEMMVSIEEIKRLKFCERYHHKRMDRSRKSRSEYGATQNYVFVPKPNDIRWQDILELKLQHLASERKPIKAMETVETGNSDVEGLLNFIEETLQKNTIISKPSSEEINYNKFAVEKGMPEKAYNPPSLVNNLSTSPKKSGMNIFYGLENQKVLHKLNKKSGFENSIATDVTSPKRSSIKPISKFSKPFSNEEEAINNKNEKDDNKNENDAHENNNSEKPFEFNAAGSQKIQKNEPSSYFSVASISKLRILSRFLNKSQRSVGKKLKVIDFMLMVDCSVVFVSTSQNDVMVNAELRRKQHEVFILEEKLKNCQCAMKYKTNLIDSSALQQRRMKKQTKLIAKLPGMGRETHRTNDRFVIKSLMYGKNQDNCLRLPILSCGNFVIIQKWRKKVHRAESEGKFNSFNKIRPMISSPKAKTKNKTIKRKEKKVKTLVLGYKEMGQIIRENLNQENEEEDFKGFGLEDDYIKIKKNDYDHKAKMDFISDLDVNLHWSGENVLCFKSRVKSLKEVEEVQSRMNKILRALSSMNQDPLIWLPEFSGKLMLAKKYVILFIESQFFENIFLLAVVLNTVVLSLYGYLTSTQDIEILDTINKDLTFVFVAEMGIKILGLGIVGYVSSLMNVFDGAIVVVSLLDYVLSSVTTNVGAFRSIRILRIFRILRPLHYMKKIIQVFSSNFFSFIYIGFLLILLIMIYTLIGVQIYAGGLNNQDTNIRQSFDSMYLSFLSVFQLVTIENWNDIETITLYSGVGASLTVFYLLSVIILGNYVFLNLLLGVLLDGFSNKQVLDDDYDDPFDEEMYLRKKKREEDERKKNEMLAEDTFLRLDSEEWEQILSYTTMKSSRRELFAGVECTESLWVFPKSSLFRVTCYLIANNLYFDYFILSLIFANSVKLGLDTYIPSDGTASSAYLQDVSDNLDIFFNSCFLFEAALKIVAYGLFLDRGSYLRSYWNVLDFFIAIFSLIDMALTSINIPFLKIFRMMRVLRMVSHNPNMKMVVMALFQSIGPLLNLIIFIFFIFLIFAIMGVTLMGGKFGYCSSLSPYYGVNKNSCIEQNQKWTVFNPNFDNVFNGLLAVFILSTQEGWPTIMYFAMDGDEETVGPSSFVDKNIGWYFVIALSVLNFFLINMFVGVLCDQFVTAKENVSPEKNYFVSKEQKLWINYQSFILKAHSSKIAPKIPKNKFRLVLYRIVSHQAFDFFLMFCITANIITLGLNYEGASDAYDSALETINYVFTGVFVVEFLVKIIAFGPKSYISSNWNKFDFLIVVCSLAEIITTQSISGSVSFLRIGPQIIRIFRVLRVTRILKLVRKFQDLTKLIETLISALPSIANVGALYLLVYYIFAILGVFFFDKITDGQIIDEYNNFNNVWYSFVLCFRMVTGENWWVVMYDCSITDSSCIPNQTCGTAYAPIYFISLQIVQAFVIQSLFILVILEIQEDKENPVDSFKKLLKAFRAEWNKFTKHTEHKKIHSKDLIPFFKGFKNDLGFGNMNTRKIGVEIMKMHLESDPDNYIHFHDVLFSTLKRVYGNSSFDNLRPETVEYVTKIEVFSRNKLKSRRLKAQKPSKSHQIVKIVDYSQNHSEESSPKEKGVKGKVKIANPLVGMLFLGMVWRAWFSYTQRKTVENLGESRDEDDSGEELTENIH